MALLWTSSCMDKKVHVFLVLGASEPNKNKIKSICQKVWFGLKQMKNKTFFSVITYLEVFLKNELIICSCWLCFLLETFLSLYFVFWQSYFFFSLPSRLIGKFCSIMYVKRMFICLEIELYVQSSPFVHFIQHEFSCICIYLCLYSSHLGRFFLNNFPQFFVP